MSQRYTVRLTHLNEYDITPPKEIAFPWDEGDLIYCTVIRSLIKENIIALLLRTPNSDCVFAALNIVEGIGGRRILDDTTIYIGYRDYARYDPAQYDSWPDRLFKHVDRKKHDIPCPNALFPKSAPIHDIS